MPRYALAGMMIVSDLELPELVQVEGAEAAWRFELRRERLQGELAPIHAATTVDGVVWLEILRDKRRYVLRFPDLADFVLVPSRRIVSCVAAEGVGASTVRHLLLDQVVPHLLAMDGSLVLHASAIECDGRAVAFAGPSGSGKSSLAASFAAEGFSLVADDFLLLAEAETGFEAVPSYPGLRLWPDSIAALAPAGSSLAPVRDEGEKRRLPSGSPSGRAEPMPLQAVVILGGPCEIPGVDVSVDRVSARTGFMALFGQAFRMERVGRERHLDELDRFARLARSTALLRIDYQREYSLLPEVQRGILDALNGGR